MKSKLMGSLSAVVLAVGVVMLALPPSLMAQSGTKSFRSLDQVDLPPIAQRKVLGTWLRSGLGTSYTMSFERANSKVFRVDRYPGGEGGGTGSELQQTNAKTFLRVGRSTGDNYVILSNGNLSVRDVDGEIEQLRPHKTLFP